MMSYQASSVPKWVAEKLQSAITKNLTLPSCADIPLPYLLPVDHPDAGTALPGFLRSLQGGALPHIPSCITLSSVCQYYRFQNTCGPDLWRRSERCVKQPFVISGAGQDI